MGRHVMFLLALAGGGFLQAGTHATEAHEPDEWTSNVEIAPAATRTRCEVTTTKEVKPSNTRTHEDCLDVDPHEVDARTRVDGPTHSLAVTDDGRLFAWGDNRDGQLGTGAIGGHFHRPQLVPGRWRSDAGAIAAGERHSLAIRDDGTVGTWGHDGSCEGSSLGAALPRTVTFVDGTPLRDVISVAAGLDVSYALTRDGTLWSWRPGSDAVVAPRLAAR